MFFSSLKSDIGNFEKSLDPTEEPTHMLQLSFFFVCFGTKLVSYCGVAFWTFAMSDFGSGLKNVGPIPVDPTNPSEIFIDVVARDRWSSLSYMLWLCVPTA